MNRGHFPLFQHIRELVVKNFIKTTQYKYIIDNTASLDYSFWRIKFCYVILTYYIEVAMPAINELSRAFDTGSKEYRKALKNILDNKLRPSERRIYANWVCTETHKRKPSDTIPKAHQDPEKLKSIIE